MPTTRREFIKTSTIAGTAAAFPMIIPSHVLRGQTGNNRILVGQIGAGRIATQHDIPGVIKAGGDAALADYAAVCDLDSKRLEQGKQTIQNLNGQNKRSAPPEIGTYTKYEELLARRDIDAVVISLPDHQHAEVCLAAIRAGKDVYLQKPFTMTHEESVMLRDEIVKSGRIFQIGSQQRSWGNNDQFRKACEFVRNGRVGNLKAVEIGLPIDPTAPDQPEQPVPPNLDYDRWLGPTPQVYYTEQRVHSQRDVGSRPGWLRNEAFCLGMITGWGAHHFDTAHWGMNTELTGPLKAEGRGDFPTNKVWNVHGAYYIELMYPGNIKMTVTDKFPNGIKFIGDEGWIFVSRDAQGATSSDPAARATSLKPLDASDPKLLEPGTMKVQLQYSREHHENWLEAVKSRKPTNVAPAPIAHRSNAACIVAWVAMKTGRPLNWDPKTEKFVDDAQANALLSRPERAPYGAMRLSRKA